MAQNLRVVQGAGDPTQFSEEIALVDQHGNPWEPPGAAKVTAARPGNRLVSLGDSIVKADDTPTVNSYRHSWPSVAAIQSNQRVQLVNNAGVAGDTTAMMIIRFAADVAAFQPNLVAVAGGTNDIGQSVDPAVTRSNLAELVRLVRSAGAVPVLATVTPNATTTARVTATNQLNRWIRDYAGRQGISVLDFYGLLVDEATGGLRAEYNSGDGSHPNSAGYVAMGKYAASVLTPLTPPRASLLPADAVDASNLVAQPLFLGAVSPTLPAGWSAQSGGVTGVTYSVEEDAAIPGKWAKMVLAASTGNGIIFQNITTGIPGLAGRRYALAVRLQTQSLVGSQVTVRARWTATSNRDDQPVDRVTADLDGVVYFEGVVPAGATALQLSVVATPGSGTIKAGQVSVTDLTAVGV